MYVFQLLLCTANSAVDDDCIDDLKSKYFKKIDIINHTEKKSASAKRY